MRKLFILPTVLIAVLALTGCSPSYPMKEQPNKKITYTPEPPSFKPEPAQVAMLYNAGLKKSLLRSKTNEYFTVIAPKFYEYSYTVDRNPSCRDFHLSLIPPGTYYDEEGALEKEHTVVSIEFVSSDNYANYDTNIWRQKTMAAMLSEEDYNTKEFETYDAYVKAYEDAVKVLYTPTGEEGSIHELTGQLEPIRGSRLTDKIVIDEVEYKLPWVTYRFNLETGNYLFIRFARMCELTCSEFDEGGLLSRLVLPKKELSNKEKAKITDYLSNFDLDYYDTAQEILYGIIIGDLSEYYKPTKQVRPDNDNVDTEFEDSVSENSLPTEDEADDEKDTVDEETFGNDVNVKQQQYKEELKKGAVVNNPNDSDNVVNGFKDEDSYGGYNDYNVDDGDLYYED